MKHLLIVLAALSANPAQAANDDAVWNPPPRFDHEPTIPVKIDEMDPFSLQGICGRIMGFTPGQYFRACTIPNLDGTCYIFMIDRPAYGTTPQAVYRHERGHCNGWKH